MTQITNTTRTIFSADGLSLFVQQWVPQSPRAWVVLAHGLGEHSGRYNNVVDVLLPAGIAVAALDHRGHGRSEGQRAFVKRFDQFHDDLGQLISEVSIEAKGLPVFLAGHSLGGLIVLSYALARPEGLSGVVSSGAALKLAVEVPAVKRLLGNVTSKFIPKLSLNNELDPQSLSHDPAVVEAYIADPLVHPKITTRLFTEMVATMASTVERAGELTLPCLLMHGDADPICNPEGSRAFYDGLTVEDRTLLRYEGFYHEIFNEIGKEKPLNDMREWLLKRVGESDG
ncbi:MAG: lysophospholipase [Candidatus Alcyoniella australis]|nr:lysophospholipase [Candidatus Alcyoniella australis]